MNDYVWNGYKIKWNGYKMAMYSHLKIVDNTEQKIKENKIMYDKGLNQHIQHCAKHKHEVTTVSSSQYAIVTEWQALTSLFISSFKWGKESYSCSWVQKCVRRTLILEPKPIQRDMQASK